MGADLYINSIYDKQTELYESKFHEAVNFRDSLPEGEERDKAQEQVGEYLRLWNEKGYFRDSYNSSSLFWLLGLSWWKHIVPLLDDEGGLPITEAQKLIGTISERMHTHYPESFSDFCSENFPLNAENREKQIQECDEFFKAKAEKLSAMLKQSIELNEPISCSL